MAYAVVSVIVALIGLAIGCRGTHRTSESYVWDFFR